MPNKQIARGFGTGSSFGTPTTIGLAPTSTLSITSSLVGQYHVMGIVTGVQLTQVSTSNSVTDTMLMLNGAPGIASLDGTSAFLVNTTTSVTILLINTL